MTESCSIKLLLICKDNRMGPSPEKGSSIGSPVCSGIKEVHIGAEGAISETLPTVKTQAIAGSTLGYSDSVEG
jgi:hypothetical protein